MSVFLLSSEDATPTGRVVDGQVFQQRILVEMATDRRKERKGDVDGGAERWMIV